MERAESPVVDSLTDPRAISLLTAEHWSLLSARSLAYNEAFVRGGMFLTFLSMSFVGLALLAQAIGFAEGFLGITAIVLLFDLVIGLTTYGRILGANFDDLRAVHGMARLRHGYAEIAPIVTRYFTTPMHDDAASVSTVYAAPSGGLAAIGYGLTTSSGMIGLITAMVGGVLAAVLGVLVGLSPGASVWIGFGAGAVVFGGMVGYTYWAIASGRAELEARFPATGGQTAIREE
ncbi:MAG TPA: hypothetical protein VJ839_01495 [Candidatus Limnocylindria bacterium]|nr:hypothetical protein [Candidatus Limnocylindria bacterium]